MHIKRLLLRSFGKFKNYELKGLTAGMNIICGPNEAGKSTIAAFIRAMMYSFPVRRIKELSVDDRAKYTNWDGTDMEGELDICLSDGKTFTINRRITAVGGGSRRDKVTIIDKLTGETVSEAAGMEPGEYFFNMSGDTYVRTLYIGQQDHAVSGSNDEIGRKLSNLKQSADEDISYLQALNTLKGIRRSISNQLRKGKLDAILNEITIIRDEIAELQRLNEEIYELEEKMIILKHNKAKMITGKESYENISDIKNYFGIYEAALKKLSNVKELLTEAEKEKERIEKNKPTGKTGILSVFFAVSVVSIVSVVSAILAIISIADTSLIKVILVIVLFIVFIAMSVYLFIRNDRNGKSKILSGRIERLREEASANGEELSLSESKLADAFGSNDLTKVRAFLEKSQYYDNGNVLKITEEIGTVFREITEIKAGKRSLAEAEEELALLEEESAKLKDEFEAAGLAIDILEDCHAKLKSEYLPPLNSLVTRIYSNLTGGRYNDVRIEPVSMDLSAGGDYSAGIRNSGYLSLGTNEQLYLSLRMGIAAMISDGFPDGLPPVILDDSFLHFDEERKYNALKFFKDWQGQIILFTIDSSDIIKNCGNYIVL